MKILILFPQDSIHPHFHRTNLKGSSRLEKISTSENAGMIIEIYRTILCTYFRFKAVSNFLPISFVIHHLSQATIFLLKLCFRIEVAVKNNPLAYAHNNKTVNLLMILSKQLFYVDGDVYDNEQVG